MKFSFLCIGTYGDVAPYVALGAKLKAEGHEVVICAHEKARSLCGRFSLPFHPVNGDLSVQTSLEESNELFEAKGIKKFVSFFKMMRLFRGVLDIHLHDCLQGAKGADVLIYHPAAFAGPHVAEYLQIGGIRMFLQPEIMTSQHPSCVIPMPNWLGRIGHVTGHFISQQLFWQIFRGKINRWRQKILQLQSSPFWKPTHYSRIGNLVAFSPVLIPRPSDWHPSIGMVGFNLLQEAHQWSPSSELQHFLSDDPPLFLGFGSLTDHFSPSHTAIIIDVLIEKKIKTIISKNLPGLKEMDKRDLPYHILPMDYVPHDWLFPRVSAVIHHGGVGTLSTGLYAGKPTWVIPCIADQFFFGEKVFEWGVDPKPLAKIDFNRKSFEEGLDLLIQNPSYRIRALQLQQDLKQENGVEQAYEWILEYVKEKEYTQIN